MLVPYCIEDMLDEILQQDIEREYDNEEDPITPMSELVAPPDWGRLLRHIPECVEAE